MRVTLILLLMLAPAPAQDALGKALGALRAAPREKRAEAIKAVLALNPTVDQVIERLEQPVAVTKLAAGWHLLEATATDGVTRPYQLYLPPGLELEPVPLLVHLHGGVNRPDFDRKRERLGAGLLWLKLADKHKFVVVFPMARRDCIWWSDAGAAHVRATIREAKRFAPIDDDAIVGTGFSDGGSGCYYLALAEPDPFAAFIPMNGHPAVPANYATHQLYLHNLKGSPLFVTMTQDDQLYPAAAVFPHLTPVLARGAPMHVVSYPTGGHRPVYFDEQAEVLARFVADTPRDPFPMDLEWRCADAATGRYRWVEILDLGAAEGDAGETADINLMSTPGRVRLGINVDRNYAEAVRVTVVVEGSLAAKLGMQPGDIVSAVDATLTPNLPALAAVLGAKRHGDAVKVTIWRLAEERVLEGRFPPFRSEPYYRRKTPTAHIRVNVEEQTVHVTSRNVRKFRLRLAPLIFGSGPVALRVNGRAVEAKPVSVTLEALLAGYARDADAGHLFTREVVVDRVGAK